MAEFENVYDYTPTPEPDPKPDDPEPKPDYHNPFVDVKEGDFYYDAVMWAVQKDITKGTSDTTFSPADPCTRGQIVTFLYRHFV